MGLNIPQGLLFTWEFSIGFPYQEIVNDL